MKTFGNLIIEKMKEEFYPQLNFDFIMNLSNESRRGAVLIGTAKVEDHINQLLTHLLPRESKKYRDKLLEYPGTISTLSSKMELLFGFRIIDERLYKSLLALKALRNKAAHTSSDFSIKEIKASLGAVLEFELHFDEIIDKIATENLVRFKKHQMLQAIKEDGPMEDWKYKILEEKYETLLDNPDVKEQLIIWKLSYGLTLICIKLMVLIDEYSLLKNRKLTWIEILEEKNTNNSR